MTLMVQYRFVDDLRYFTCYMSYTQYLIFRQLQIVKECKVLKRNQSGYKKYVEDMKNALIALEKNDKNLLGRLSWPKYFLDKKGRIILEKNTVSRF